MPAGLRVERISTAYDRADVLQDVSIEVEPHSITCLLGSNGSGKTTLIRSILGLTPPRTGRVWFEERVLTGLPTHKVIAAGIACIPEGRKVFPKLTVEENLRVGGYQEASEELIRARLAEEGIGARVVSMPCREWFDAQEESYRETVIPPTVKARVSVEAGIAQGWREVVGDHGRIISIETYGASADFARIFQEYGVTTDAVVAAAHDSIAAVTA